MVTSVRKNIYRANIIGLLFLVIILMAGCSIKKDKAVDGGKAVRNDVLPLLCTVVNNQNINFMLPYEEKMNTQDLYGSLITSGNSSPVNFSLVETEKKPKSITYSIFDENGSVISTGESDNISGGNFTLTFEGLEKKERKLEVCVTDDIGQKSFYYSRIAAGGNGFAEQLKYAEEFENACLGLQSSVDLTFCLETDYNKSYPSYYSSEIYSSYNHVRWEGLGITDHSNYSMNILEATDEITSLSVNYTITGADKISYEVEDFLRLRMYDNKVYLISFNRQTSEIFSHNEKNFEEKKLTVGVGSGVEGFLGSDDGKRAYFVQNGSLYFFDHDANRISLIYVSNDVESYGKALTNKDYAIKPLYEDGRFMYFLTSGYMTGKLHSGLCGVGLVRYDIKLNEYKELLCIPTDYSPQLVVSETKEFSYMGDKGKAYFYIDEKLYCFDVNSNELSTKVKSIQPGSFAGSESNGLIAYEKLVDGGDNPICISDLKNETEREQKKDLQMKIAPIGFIKEDFVYGVLSTDTGKQKLFSKICIENKKNETVKEYEQPEPGKIMDAFTTDVLVSMKIANQVEDGVMYQIVGDHQIVSGNKENLPKIIKKTETNVNRGDLIEIIFGTTFKGTPAYSEAELQLSKSDVVKSTLNISEKYEKRYFVYINGQLDRAYDVMSDALCSAEKNAGVVLAGNADKVYYRCSKNSSNQLSPVDSAIGETILSSQNGIVEAWKQIAGDKYVLDITGFVPEDILMFIDRGFPVLARYSRNEFVWITGYTDSSITCQNIDNTETFSLTKTQAEDLFKRTGYEYYTCNN